MKRLKALDRGFYIPLEPQFTALQFWQCGAGIADTRFPYGTWPWHVWRGASLLLSGANDQVTDLYREMYVSDDGGPLAWWVLSRLFGLFSPEHAAGAAARGLKAVDGKAFLADCDGCWTPVMPSGGASTHLSAMSPNCPSQRPSRWDSCSPRPVLSLTRKSSQSSWRTTG